jgi:hypothetical protein
MPTDWSDGNALMVESFWTIEERFDDLFGEELEKAVSNHKRFIKLRTLRTLRIIFTVMVNQTEIGRAQKFLGF